MQQLMVGSEERQTIFDRTYEILAAVGRGRNSVVYKAKKIESARVKGSPVDEQVVALKVLLGNSKHPEYNQERMRHEALAMLSARHRNVIRLNDFIASTELFYLSMEYASEGDLRTLLEKQGRPFDSFTVLRYMCQVLSGLEAIHRVGIVHRDIKPENLLLCEDGQVKIADFGIAYLPTDKPSLEDLSRGVGTFDYLAPECLERGNATPVNDVYSVGVTCFELLTNHFPFVGNTFSEQIENKMRGRRLPLGAYVQNHPLRLEDLLVKALDPCPERRFQSAREFREAIENLQEESDRYVSPTKMFSMSSSERAEQLGIHEHSMLPPAPGNVDESKETFTAKPDFVVPTQEPRTTIDSHARRWRMAIFVGLVSVVLICSVFIVWQIAQMLSDREESSRLGSSSEVPLGFTVSAELGNTLNHFIRDTRVGVLHGLLMDGQDVALIMSPVDERRVQMVVGIGIPGFLPQVVAVDRLLTRGVVEVANGGMKIVLFVDPERTTEERLEGSFVDQTSGRGGRWVIW